MRALRCVCACLLGLWARGGIASPMHQPASPLFHSLFLFPHPTSRRNEFTYFTSLSSLPMLSNQSLLMHQSWLL
ncbi:hypothetical protein DL98DRAFT_508435 [Cadophora sp. DSE1049]|nr:hypothetical protein DL98DRAFT_508435 [Cadophora sp. DSE1049]